LAMTALGIVAVGCVVAGVAIILYGLWTMK
jgi:hypothetical protein